MHRVTISVTKEVVPTMFNRFAIVSLNFVYNHIPDSTIMHYKIFPFLLFLLSITNLKATKPTPTIEQALILAAEQQVLSQRIAKVYIALCNNMKEPRFYQERDAVIETFDEQLHQLSLFVPTDKIKDNIQKVRSIWKEYKEIAAWSIKKDAASKLLKQSNDVLQAIKLLQAAYLEYEISLAKPQPSNDWLTINQYIKNCNNQEILIHRVLMYYLAEKEGIDATISGHQMDEAQKTFTSALEVLTQAKLTSKSIQAKLAAIKKSWAGISMHLVFVDKDQSYVNDMLLRGDEISKLIKEIIKTYQELGVKLSIGYAINEATAQSMHVQKIAKSYIASFNESVAYKYKKEVLEHVEDFEKKMNTMSIAAPTEEMKNAITVVQTMWKNFKKLVTDFETMDEVRVIKVLEQCHVVMAACDRVADAVEHYAQSIPAYRIFSEKDGVKVDPSLDITYQIRVSSQLRIYSERVALYFMTTTLNLDSDVSLKRMKSCISDFDPKFKDLSTSRINTSAINVLLETCQKEWQWITNTCENPKKENIDAMLEHAELLSKMLMKLTDLYEHRMNDLFAEDIIEESPSALNGKN